MIESSQNHKNTQHIFTGNIYIFHAFDVGDDINLEKIEKSSVVKTVSLPASKYFKNYHRPIGIELANPASSPYCVSCKVHNFGVVSFTYKIPFTGTLESMRKEINSLDFHFFEQSSKDSKVVFDAIKDFVSKSFFYHMRSAYSVFQIDPQPEVINIPTLKENYGGIIASSLRFETETLAEYKKNEILESAIGYFRGDLIIVDSYATFLYDAEYEELLDLFEFANIQQLELHYFDLILDQQLNLIYEGRVGTVPTRAYFPFIGVFAPDPVGFMGKLKADISVITERLEGALNWLVNRIILSFMGCLCKSLI